MSDKQYCTYIMTNAHNTVLYTGVTNNLQRRVLDHRAGKTAFTKKYNITKLVYFESGDDINIAIAREKQLKGGSRQNKVDLINSMNPEWKDLYEVYFGTTSVTASPKGEAVSSNVEIASGKEQERPRNDTTNTSVTARNEAVSS